MNAGLTILVCLLVIVPVVTYVGWKLWKPMAMEHVNMYEEGLRRRAGGAAPAVAETA
jgi:uncharacterized protein YjeT (DUF2065 family)